MSSPSGTRGQYRWRIYLFWSVLVAAVATIVHLLAHVSLIAAILAALAGSLVNGILILVGEGSRRRNSADGSSRHPSLVDL